MTAVVLPAHAGNGPAPNGGAGDGGQCYPRTRGMIEMRQTRCRIERSTIRSSLDLEPHACGWWWLYAS
jgi:hypothetical protein